MEPLSALAIATSVVQFIDFSSKVISGSHELHESSTGLSRNNTSLHEVTNTLLELSRGIELCVPPGGSSEHGEHLRILCHNINQVATDLIAALEEIRLKGNTRWESGYRALKNVWGRERLQTLQNTLNEYRQQLTLGLIVLLRDEIYATVSKNQTATQSVDEMQEQLLQYISENRRWHADIMQTVQDRYESRAVYDPALFTPDAIQRLGLQPSADKFLQLVLNSLEFRGKEDRYDRIANRHLETFEWIFSADDQEGIPWTNFVRWLGSESTLYWITGKAGSGKSTLMKFLNDDQRTSKLLSSARQLPVVQAGFYFWNSGTELQMSQIGLLRTLLSQLLDSCKNSAPVAMPVHWEAFNLLKTFRAPQWTWHELRRTFLQLAEHICASSILLLFIDGLDEYNGSHTALIQFLKELSTTLPNVKLCVSSRPWVVFEDAFKSTPSLLMQDITRPDMITYAENRFQESLGFQELKIEDSAYANKLIHEISDRSSGVFLWVVLVVESLLDGLTNGDRTSDLQQRLDDLPTDLEDLFQRIFDDIDPMYRQHSSELFCIFRAAAEFEPPTIITFTFADQPNVESAILQPIKPFNEHELQSIIGRTRRRLNSRCKGLLEPPHVEFIRPNTRVMYLHRTVKDFVEAPLRWKTVIERAPSTFDPEFQLAKSFLMQLKTTVSIAGTSHIAECIEACLKFLSLAKKSPVEIKTKLADDLDATISEIAVKSDADANLPSFTSFKGVEPHWTHIDGLIGTSIQQPSSFIHLMISLGQDWYVQSKLDSFKTLEVPKNTIPPLFSASHIHTLLKRRKEGLEHFAIVKLLLEHGANPNTEFQNVRIVESHWHGGDLTQREQFRELLRSYGAVGGASERFSFSVQKVPPGLSKDDSNHSGIGWRDRSKRRSFRSLWSRPSS